MFENLRRGRQARNFTTNVPEILDLKSSSEQIFSENWRWVPLEIAEEDTILTALDMTAKMEEKLEEILERLKKLSVI